MKQIALTQGLFALVDDEDFESLNAHKWRARKDTRTWYAARTPCINGKYVLVLMHRCLLGAEGKEEGDHIDGNGLNNQRDNLRLVTCQQNHCNRTRKKLNASSQFRGVCWNKRESKWQATIMLYGDSFHLGRFDSEHAAAQAYDDAGFLRDPIHFTPTFPRITIQIDRT